MHSQNAALGSDRWLTINKSFLKTTACAAFVVAALSGCSNSPKSFEQMSGDDQLNYLRTQADSALLAEVSNAVPHIRAVIEENADTFGGSVDQWKGWVRLDYLDSASGIQQTNLHLAFAATFDGHLFSSAPRQPKTALLDIVNSGAVSIGE